MLKRTGFARINLTEIQARDRAPAVLSPTTIHPATRKAVMAPVSDKPAAPVLKDELVRSEAYRRLVAQFACKNCGIAGHSQAAHTNRGAKGMGLKADDRDTAPLCADRPGIVGCHTRFDRYELFPADIAERVMQAWIADTQRQIEAAGLWPKNLPKRSES